jgi:two-component system sensor histidine kinase BarA
LRHFNFILSEILEDISIEQTRVIIMHYEQTMINARLGSNLDSKLVSKLDFISITTNSLNLKKLLDTPQNDSAITSPILSLPIVSKKILLVDDNKINLKLASELIGLWGHQAYEAENALQAMTLYKKESFDLIVLDIQMPEIDGIDLLKMIRNEKALDQTPTVALTANILDDEEQRLLQLGFNYYLSKPIDEEKFRSILDGSSHVNSNLTKLTPEQEFDQTTSTMKPSIDFELSLKLCENNNIILCNILDILVNDIPSLQLELKSAAFQNNREELSAILHKLHGITCYTNLPRLTQQVSLSQRSLTTFSNGQQQDAALKIHDELNNIKNETQHWLEQRDNGEGS